MTRAELKEGMKKDRKTADEELEKAREKLKSVENIKRRLQFPHALDMDITDAALERLPDTSTEFYLFNESLKVLDYMCMRGGDVKEGNRALRMVLEKLSGPHTEEDMVKIQASVTNLREIMDEELKRTPVNLLEAREWSVENKTRADVWDPAMRKFQNNIQNNTYRQLGSDYSR